MTSAQTSTPKVLLSFAHSLGTGVRGNTLYIPPEFGSGYCAGYIFNEHIRMLISDYELKEGMIIHNAEANKIGQMIFFKFQHIFPKDRTARSGDRSVEGPSVLIGTSLLNTADEIYIHTNTSTINIEVAASYLSGILGGNDRSPILQSLLQNAQPLLFDQMIDPAIVQAVREMLKENVADNFKLFFLRIKAEELICRLLMTLDERDERQLYPLNDADIQSLYKVRSRMLDHLDAPPLINDLATEAGKSPTKLKRLFKQIFGDSIFRYYQQFRIKEAARLLRDDKLSVTDTGYRMGFTNLSHFTKVFEEIMGMKPKRYSLMK